MSNELINVICPECGGKITVNSQAKYSYCPVCASQFDTLDAKNGNVSSDLLRSMSGEELDAFVSGADLLNKRQLKIAYDLGSAVAAVKLGEINAKEGSFYLAKSYFQAAADKGIEEARFSARICELKTQERTVSRTTLRELSSADKGNFKYLAPGTVDMFSRILSEKGTELDEKERLERLREHETYERGYEVPTPRYVAPGILDNGFGPYCADAGELVDDIIQRNNDIYGAGYIANRQSLEEINENIYLTDSEKEEAARRIDPLYMHR